MFQSIYDFILIQTLIRGSRGKKSNKFHSLTCLGCNIKAIKLFDPPINDFRQKVVYFQKFSFIPNRFVAWENFPAFKLNHINLCLYQLY